MTDRAEINQFINGLGGGDLSAVVQALRNKYDAAICVFVVEDVESVVGRELTAAERLQVINNWYWYRGLEDHMAQSGFAIMDDLLIDAGIEKADEDTD